VVVLATELDDSLVSEGLARELVHAIQTARKDQNCQYTDRIEVGVVTDDAGLRDAAKRFAEYIQGETLASRLGFEPLPSVQPIELNLAGQKVRLFVRVVSS
jgi:isoleucyl-tRNA synthetase